MKDKIGLNKKEMGEKSKKVLRKGKGKKKKEMEGRVMKMKDKLRRRNVRRIVVENIKREGKF